MNLMHTKIRIYFLWVFFLKNNVCMSVEKNKNTCNEHPNKEKIISNDKSTSITTNQHHLKI